MNIDWFTFIAQLVNFLILVLLLRWLLYGPITRAMEQREAAVKARMEEAQQQREKAAQEARQYEQKRQELEAAREELLQSAQEEAKQHQKRLTSEAQVQLERKREDWRKAFVREQEGLQTRFQQDIGQLAVEGTRRILQQLADAPLEQEMMKMFAAQLRNLEQAQKQEVMTQLQAERGIVFLRSAFALTDSQRQQIRELVHEQFGYDGDISFEQTPALLCGIELELAGYSFEWDANAVLTGLQTDYQHRLQQAPSSSHVANSSEGLR